MNEQFLYIATERTKKVKLHLMKNGIVYKTVSFSVEKLNELKDGNISTG